MALRVRPHLILLDMNLPGMDGRRTLAALRAIPELHDIPVPSATPDEIESALGAGFDGYLTKPLVIDIVRSELDGHLANESR
jgi:CheY-like chemotaxis protein